MPDLVDSVCFAADFLEDNPLAADLRSLTIGPSGAQFHVTGDAGTADAWQESLFDVAPEILRLPETIDHDGKVLNELRGDDIRVFVRRASNPSDWMRIGVQR